MKGVMLSADIMPYSVLPEIKATEYNISLDWLRQIDTRLVSYTLHP
jgi:hypothetical protein